MRDNWDFFKRTIQSYNDHDLIEKVREIDTCDGNTEFVNNMAKNAQVPKEYVIKCILEEYDKRKKDLGFRVLIIYENIINFFNK